MPAHILDRPVWSALTTRLANVSQGDDVARRLHPDIGPFAATRDDTDHSLKALIDLIPADGSVLLLQADPIQLPASLTITQMDSGVQMVMATAVLTPIKSIAIEPLSKQDAAEMVALATLTEPGPFLSRTHELGDFYGVRADGRLVAMAGERFKHEGYTELSGICTHPKFRGRGLARTLSSEVARRIIARGETPYLHTYAGNSGAIGLYESLGFELRCSMHLAVVERS